jgi:DNA invertase Pin-like site-specific DNA recombinase
MTVSLRCAIYTRVSSDAGLEQDFNSLDAQRESALAYVKSQAHEGWRFVRERFDDGGFSGGSMERPALQRLLDLIRARRIDAVVVYKVDRLTRSLADFAKLVELFDAHNVSFVSVTQAFNTTTSMGRLTLNVLLSFAQFEREVTGERIRDKIAASKKKGLWMGGVVPLGYRVVERKLVVEPGEAATVRLIFARYLELGSVRALQRDLRDRDVRTRVRVLASAQQVGGVHLTNGPLCHILRNRHYLGEINHRGRSWPGEHEAIVDPERFQKVQERLKGQRVARSQIRDKSRALLAGKLFNDANERLTPTYAIKGGVRYGYYVSTSAMQSRDRSAAQTHRLPAARLDATVVDALRRAVARQEEPDWADESDKRCPDPDDPSDERQSRSGPDRLASSGDRTTSLEPRNAAPDQDAKTLIAAHLVRVRVQPDRLAIEYRTGPGERSTLETIVVGWAKPPSRVRRTLIEPTSDPENPRPMESLERDRLIRGIATARGWVQELIDGSVAGIDEFAKRESRSSRSIRMTLSLAFLDPAIVRAACAGTLPRGYGASRLADLPPLFADQWRALGLAQPPPSVQTNRG